MIPTGPFLQLEAFLIFVWWCVHQEWINQVTPFKEEPGQSILQPDSDELPHFSQFADFTQISRTKFGCDILQLYTAQQWRLQHSKVSLCIKCTLSKIGRCWGGWLLWLCSGWRFNIRSKIREWPKCSLLSSVVSSIQFSDQCLEMEYLLMIVFLLSGMWKVLTLYHCTSRMLALDQWKKVEQRCKKRAAWAARCCYFWAAYEKNMLKFAKIG